ncbi:hypothetical protein ABE28_019100 [Peribacillus muralis]|uniref:Uncharacterized protein n=1 Tax=Peribacillus muralis TaxID=264697 RepID=A0A1B3XTF2_9BACI|nr:hypothetical protein ABE28_019100 [Peribacillus muralis]
MIGVKKAQSALGRWRKTVHIHGEQGFLEERRGKSSTGRPKSVNVSSDKKLAKAEAGIQLLEAELTLLKKLNELERKAKKKQLQLQIRSIKSSMKWFVSIQLKNRIG